MGYKYDLIVIGGGAAGLVASKFAAGIGRKVVLVEKDRLGGECTLYGCVPSKALIKSARLFYEMNHAEGLGLKVPRPEPVSGHEILDRVRSVVSRIYEGHKPETLVRQGIEVVFGSPRFIDEHRIELNGQTLSADAFIVCTGSSPLVPPIPGLNTVSFLTNETLFDLKELPGSLIILGGGPIGIEIAQAFMYLGVTVTVVEMGEQILAREDSELSTLLANRLIQQGLVLRTGTKAVSIAAADRGVELTVEDNAGRSDKIKGDAVLVAVGRKANVDGLHLEASGVDYSQKGIKANDRLQTTADNIYVCGDVTGPYQFSHMAEYQARLAGRNALLPFKAKADYRNYIWCTFTNPEFAHAGLTEDEARLRYGEKIRIYRWHYQDTDRGKTEADEFGMGKFICDSSHRLVGAHILGARAGDLIHEAQIVKTLSIPFYKLDSVIHVYPTLSDVVRQPAKIARIERLRNMLFVKILGRLFGKGRT